MLVKLADLIIEIKNRYAYTAALCKDYIVETGEADFHVFASDADILAEEGGKEAPAYAESLAVYRKIAEEILSRDGFLLHGAVAEVQGQGVAFLAKSGVGKSTHLRLWQALLGDHLTVINGDKPLVRFKDGVPFVYGTPWAGKEKLQTNKGVPLTKICFLSRGTENEAFSLPKEDALLSLLPQIYMPKDGKKMELLLGLLARLIESCDFYGIHCTISPEAAEKSYHALFG